MKPAVKKWMPAAAIPAVIAAMGVGVGISSSATPQLEPKTPEQVIELMAGSDVEAFSGTFRTSTELGIPALPDAGAPASFGPPRDAASSDGPGAGPQGEGATDDDGSDAASPSTARDAGLAEVLNLVSGSHEVRVYVDGTDPEQPQARLQVMEDLGEKDVIRNGTSLWTYDSEANEAVHTTLPQDRQHPQDARSAHDVPTPAQLADRLLAAADPTTEVSVDAGSTVAGRDAYNLVLTPKTDQTLVEDVTIGVDAATGVPLAVSVDAVGQDAPALSAEFTSFTPGAPDAKLFDFTPPADATVHERPFPDRSDGAHDKAGKDHHPAQDHATGKDHGDWLTGSGWDAVATIPAGQLPAELAKSPLVAQMATDVDGGKLLHTSLVNILLADDGRVLVGAVPVDRLQAAADAG
ncbi:outer membrane lipoprotein carrier protein LolA [Arthrobacter sp. JSM 101049]|uniref:LolA family protein n=1 Tax=Arthrobacter sp. JSM 101049 TaxID=929097 RepID=UPI00356924C0